MYVKTKKLLFYLLSLPLFCFPFLLILSDDVLKSSVSCRLRITPMGTCETRIRGPRRRHLCDTGQKPSESQISE